MTSLSMIRSSVPSVRMADIANSVTAVFSNYRVERLLGVVYFSRNFPTVSRTTTSDAHDRKYLLRNPMSLLSLVRTNRIHTGIAPLYIHFCTISSVILVPDSSYTFFLQPRH